MTILPVVLITLLPAILWFVLWRIQDKQKEPFRAMLICFLLGIVASAPFLAVNHWWPNMLAGINPLLLLFILAFAEEVVKAVMLVIGIEFTEKWFDQIVDGLIYGSTVALGFSLAENIFYLSGLNPLTPGPLSGEILSMLNPGFLGIYLVRSLDTMLAHTMFTAFFGFFYASAYLRKAIFPKSKRGKPWGRFWLDLLEACTLHVTLFHILPNRPSKEGHFPGTLIFEGLLLASLLHGAFNLLLKGNLWGIQSSFLTVPFVALLGYLLWRMFFQHVYLRVVKMIKG